MKARRATDWINVCAAIVAISASTYAALASGGSQPITVAAATRGVPQIEPITLADGRRALVDATGAAIPLASYQRVASGSLLADPLLLALCEPERIVAFSGRAPHVRDAHRYAGKPSVDATHRLEEVIALRPDLVLVNSLGEHAWVERLRESDLVVFDLGPMWGVQTFLRNITAAGLLLGRAPLAERLAWQFEQRLEAIARHLPEKARRGGLMVSVYGNQMFGGTRGSSYHDVLSYAGLVDIAATRYQGWPKYTPEELLTLDPEVIVTSPGGHASLCAHAELRRLRACSSTGRVVEIESELLNDAGFGILEAAELIHAAVYSKPGDTRGTP